MSSLFPVILGIFGQVFLTALQCYVPHDQHFLTGENVYFRKTTLNCTCRRQSVASSNTDLFSYFQFIIINGKNISLGKSISHYEGLSWCWTTYSRLVNNCPNSEPIKRQDDRSAHPHPPNDQLHPLPLRKEGREAFELGQLWKMHRGGDEGLGKGCAERAKQV